MKDPYLDEFFKKFVEHPSFKSLKGAFKDIIKDPFWRVYKAENREPLELVSDVDEICEFVKARKRNRKLCASCIHDVLTKAKKTRRTQVFTCPGRLQGFCYPLIQGDRLFGFIIACHGRKQISRRNLEMYGSFASTVMTEVQKELELSKLYDTIRPRAIALSTIHTVHRLISSILRLDELLPRVARLSMQVLRAGRCSIMLLDERGKALIPKTIVDTGKKKLKLGKLKLGKGVQGKVAETGNAVIKRNLLSVPLVHEDVIGVITLSDKVDGKPFSVFDKEILSTLAEQAVIAIKNAQLYEEQERLAIGSIKSLAAILDTKSPYTYTHSGGFVKIVLALAGELGLSQDELRYLHYAALMPDAGKVWIPEEILRKPAKLTGREYKIIKEHPMKSVEIMKHIEVLKPCIPIILHHHERYDGLGYPDRLKGEEIPTGARIMAVADAFEAMIYKRPYRAAMSVSSAVEEIKKSSGTQFDPKVVEAFLKLASKSVIRSVLAGGV